MYIFIIKVARNHWPQILGLWVDSSRKTILRRNKGWTAELNLCLLHQPKQIRSMFMQWAAQLLFLPRFYIPKVCQYSPQKYIPQAPQVSEHGNNTGPKVDWNYHITKWMTLQITPVSSDNNLTFPDPNFFFAMHRASRVVRVGLGMAVANMERYVWYYALVN